MTVPNPDTLETISTLFDLFTTPSVAVGVYRMHRDVKLPEYGTEESACFDLSFQAGDRGAYKGFDAYNKQFERGFGFTSYGKTITFSPWDRILVPTGLVFDIPEGWSIRLHPRSGNSLKLGLTLANCEAVIDADYTDETFILLANMSHTTVDIQEGQRMAQAEPFKITTVVWADRATPPQKRSDRTGGLGSTGK